jgi:alpha-D-xyloside xylohydrolase
MRKRQMISLCLLTAALTSCGGFGGDKDMVTVNIDNPGEGAPKVVALQVIDDNIIRVRATTDASLPKKQESLMIVPQETDVKYTVDEKDGKVTVAAPAIKAVVDKQDGRITFYDAAGKLLAAEAEKGKTFKPFYVPEREIGCDVAKVKEEQRHGLSWRLVFNEVGDALYGLGQHQSEELNMLGKNEDLFQYNTKVSVPFVVSNKNFGVLWDSYSYCRFGKPDEYLQLNRAFKLYGKDGGEGHLTGTYTDRNGKSLERDEDSIYYEYAMPDASEICKATDNGGIQNLPKGFRLEGAKVVYEGFIEPLKTDLPDNPYQFILYYAGYIKVMIGGKEVVAERWRTAWNPNAYKFTADVKEKTPIRIEWQPDGGVSYVGLRVAEPRTDEQLRQLSVWSEMTPDMDYYFIAGNNLDEVISGYRTLTGKAPVYPKWALGFWQSRERYKTAGEVEENLAEFRKRHIPIDNIVQDWNYWEDDQWGSHVYDSKRYPDPQAMLDSVHQMHGRFMISVWPKFYCNTDNYKEIDSKGWMYHQAVTDSIYDWLGYMGSFYDAYDEGARKMFWRQMDENLYSKYNQGVDAWWMDASEPNVRDCTPMWYRKALSGPTALGTTTEYFNAYSIVNADAIYNGQRGVNPNQRVFLLTRSGFAGEQRYSTATWSGDIGTRWEDMRAQMTAGMNYSLSGLPFWGMDQGGFCVENRYVRAQQLFDQNGTENEDLKEWRELQARWSQFGTFIPIFRVHGQWPLREIWNIAPEDHPAYQSFVYYDKLRYRLMPYLYSMAGWVSSHDYTMMRALVMDFNGDGQVYDIKDQWMFGPSLMACPVGYYKARSRDVYFPKQCGWYDLYTGKHQDGGQKQSVDAPYDRIPVFVPEGGIIPFGPEMEWSDEKAADLINLYVYAGRDGSFELYEDEGTNYNYEQGKFATIGINYNDKDHTITFGDRKGEFDGMLKTRKFNVVYITKDSAKPLNFDNPEGKVVEYSGKTIKVNL